MQILNSQKQVKVLFNSIPHSGHYIPMTRIAQKLADTSNFQVAFSTSEYQLHKLTVLKQNVKKYGLKDDIQQMNKKGQWKQLPLQSYQVWEKQIEELIDQLQPALVVCDIFSQVVMRIVKRKKITLVINIPLPVQFLRVVDFPILKKNIPILGVTALIVNNIVGVVLPKSLKCMYKLGKYFDDSLIIVSSFFGIQDAISLPPNIKLIGTTISQQIKSSKTNFEADFQTWLDSIPKEKDIVYVTFGSLARFSQSFVDFLYEGLKKIDVAVIWSLREGQLPQKNPNFFVKKWLPQVQILQMEQVKLVITHAGWGGVMECLLAQKPMLCVPVFGDQPENAQLVQRKGIGLVLRKQSKMLIAPGVIDKPLFTHQQLQSKVDRLRTDQTYIKNLKKISNLMAEAGGVDEAVRLIKNAANNGVQHLIDKQIVKIKRRSIMPFFLFLLMLIGLSVCFCLNYFKVQKGSEL